MLAKAEQKLALSDALKAIGRAYDDLSVVISRFAASDATEVIYPLQEQIRIIGSVIKKKRKRKS
jgi:hypothetical protein